MPLKSGSSKKTISSNIGEMVRSYKKKGSIGTSKPKSTTAAVKQAAAIAYEKAGKSKKADGGIVKKQEKRIKDKGGKVTFKKDGKLPVGIY